MRQATWTRHRIGTVLSVLGTAAGIACSGSGSTEQMETASASSDLASMADPAVDPWLRIQRMSKWTGDLDGMVERGFLRVLTVYSPTLYFVDGARERGIIAEFAPAFERFLNERLKPEGKRISVVIIPVRRDQLLPFLVEGLGDLTTGNLTVTEERLEQVDFADPSYTDVQELVITSPDSPQPTGKEDLGGREIWVRPSSSYFQSLQELNEELRAAGKPEVIIRVADENLEDESILEMVSAGLLPATVMDSHKFDLLWSEVFPDVVAHREFPLRSHGHVAPAIRKNSPLLKEALNDFRRSHGFGTEFGNVLRNRYTKSNRWVKNANATNERRKYEALVDLFREYADRYDFDHLMLIAQGYQESTLDPSVRSQAGAVGVMQVLPSTAAGSPVFIPNVEETEANIHAGIKYMRYIVDDYFNDPAIDPVNRMLFAFASYNAGPNRIARLRDQAADYGLDPNKWFREVELVVQRKVGMEPVNYVSNIYKYYIAYTRAEELIRQKAAAEEEVREGPADGG